jgi:ribonucleotide monophosphatase NagD (HAD superfamily)
MIGDRPSDIAAGQRAGCRTILVETGMHAAPRIESLDGPAPPATPDHAVPDLAAAVDIVLGTPAKERA